MSLLTRLFGSSTSHCHHVAGGRHMESAEAFPEFTQNVPLSPQMDEDEHAGVYKWGNSAIPMSRRSGGRPHSESLDNHAHQAHRMPWPTDQRAFHPNTHPEGDRINSEYSNMVTDHLPKDGYSDEPSFATNWEKRLAHHHGLYAPSRHQPPKSETEIRLAVADFSEKVNADDPRDACKYLAIEEFKCLQAQQHELNPNRAATKCVKWFSEWTKCMWDQEKFNAGFNYLEARQPSKRRPFYSSVDAQKA